MAGVAMSLRRVRELREAGQIRFERKGLVAVTTSDGRLLPFNPNRVSVVIVNNASDAAFIRRSPGGTLTEGVRLDSVGGFVVRDFEQDGASIWDEFWANKATANGNLYVEALEVYE